jgi:hypothetical protein
MTMAVNITFASKTGISGYLLVNESVHVFGIKAPAAMILFLCQFAVAFKISISEIH